MGEQVRCEGCGTELAVEQADVTATGYRCQHCTDQAEIADHLAASEAAAQQRQAEAVRSARDSGAMFPGAALVDNLVEEVADLIKGDSKK
jgi:ribosome-binding protein aMBF1 (putative translation factor)